MRAIIDLPGVTSSRALALLAIDVLEVIARYNQAYLKRHKVPSIYRLGVRFRAEPWAGKVEQFASAEPVLRSGWGDCAQLCAIRVAELRNAGNAATFRVYCRGAWPKQRLFHVQVRHAPTKLYPRGRIEDISRILNY